MRGVPPDVQRFLYENVETLEAIELLALMEHNSGVAWSAELAEAKLRLPEVVLATAFRQLRKRGLIEPLAENADAYVLARASPAVRAQISRLVAAYEADRYGVIIKISEAAMDRVRQSMTRAFADAFVVGRKRGNG